MIRRVPHVLDLGVTADGGLLLASPTDPSRHATAMIERERRDVHHQFATLRFRALSEHGSWEGRSGIVPPSGLPGTG